MLASQVVEGLTDLVGADGVIARSSAARVYECDGWTLERRVP